MKIATLTLLFAAIAISPSFAFAGTATPTGAAVRAGAAASSKTCDSINQAIKALPASGGEIKLSAGIYTCSSPVIIDRDNVTIIGAGRTQTLIKAADMRPLPVVVIGSVNNSNSDEHGIPYPDRVTKNTSIRSLTIDGNFHSNPNAKDLECYNPKTNSSLNCGTDPGLFIRNNSLTIRRAEHVRISDIETRGAYSGGIVLEKKCVDVVMDNFSSTDNYFDGFAGYETAESRFSSFDVSKNQFSGISVDWGFEGNTFENGVANDNGDNGIFSQDVGRNTYQNLKLLNNHNLGIYIAGTFDGNNGGKPIPGTCDGNKISGVETSGPKLGVVINSPCRATVIEKTSVHNNDLNCRWAMDGAEVSIQSSTCSNGVETKDL
jgi:hypothetical protein